MTTPEHHNTSPREEKSIPHDIPPDSEMLAGERSSPKSRAFYMSFVAIGVTTFLSALDLTVMGTALPTIATALHDTKGDFTWVGSAYTLSSTAFIPLSGNLADAFGRQVYFPFRIGGGGIINLSEILTADLVPLSERGIYQGLLGLIWSFASGGALASKDNKSWRWLFYLNLPLTAIAFVLIVMFLSVRKPEGSVRSKLAQVDWVGNVLVIIGAGLTTIGLTWGGIRYSWSSAEVLAPLILGIFILVVFVIYEATIPERPTIPLDIVGNRTSLSGLLTTAVHGITSMSMIYYLPVFFQASLGASPIRAAVDFLPGALIIAPAAFVAGLIITVTKKYRPVNIIGWMITIIGYGLFSTVRENSVVGQWVGYQIVGAIGIGFIFSAPVFPILAPMPKNRTASAVALFAFTRIFFSTWGITIASTILQNMLRKKLPHDFVSLFPPGFDIAYAAIPAIKQLEEPLRTEVQAAFADSMAVIWQTMTGVSGLGLLLSFIMQEVEMDTTVDESYALKD
ncbi:iron permease [Mycena leptocephala]|nr:iron permease [Mycena leptocephala]